MLGQYEDPATYARRQEYLTQLQQQQPTGSGNPVGDAVGKALELLQRPSQGSQAVYENLANAALGQPTVNPLQAFASGLQGLGPMGTGTPDSISTSIQRTNPYLPQPAADVLGFAGTMASDPLNLMQIDAIPGVARVGGMLPNALSHFLPAAGADLAADTLRHAPPSFMPNLAVQDVVNTGFDRGGNWLGNLANKATELPGVGNTIERGLETISPRITATSPLERANISYMATIDHIPDVTAQTLAPFKANPALAELRSRIDEDGRILLNNGERVAYNDVFMNPTEYAHELPFELNQLSSDYTGMFGQLRGAWQQAQDALARVAPETAKAFNLKDLELEPGQAFSSRIWVPKEDTSVVQVGTQASTPLSKRGIQYERAGFTQEQGLQAGMQAVTDPLEVLGVRLRDGYEKIAQMQWAAQLAGEARYVGGNEGLDVLRLGLQDAAAAVGQAGKLRALVTDVGMGRTVTPSTLEPFRSDYPEIVDALGRVMSHQVSGAPPFAGVSFLGRGAGGGAESVRTVPNMDLLSNLRQRLQVQMSQLQDEINGSRSAVQGIYGAPRAEALDTFGLAEQRQQIEGMRGVMGLIGRAERGETIPARDLAPYREGYTTLIEPLQRAMSQVASAPTQALMNAGSGPMRTLVGPQITDVRDAVDTAVQAAKDRLQTARTLLRDTNAVKTGNTVGQGLQQVGTPALHDLWFHPEDAQAIAAMLNDKANPVLAAMSNLGGVSRSIQTGTDLGHMLIQGLPTLATDPVRALGAAWHSIQSYANPAIHDAYLAQPDVQAVLRAFPGLHIEGTEAAGELTSALGQQGGIAQMLGKVPGIGDRLAQLPGKSSAGFAGFGDYARIEALRPFMGTVAGDAQKAADLADFANHMTGVLSSRGMGIGANQRAFESGVLAFAPRYTRAALALVGDTMSGGLAGEQARAALANMLVVGTGTYIHMAQNLGQTPVLDPTDSRFMTVQVGGQRVGVGSIWVSLARVLGDAVLHPERLTDLSDLPNNQLVKFWRGRAAPVSSVLVDLMTNADFGGNPVTNPVQFAEDLATRIEPFSAGGAFRAIGQGDIAGAPLAGLTTAIGAREFPQGRADVQNDVGQQLFGRDYQQLGPLQREQVGLNPRVQAIPIPPGAHYDVDRQAAAVNAQYGQQAGQLAAQVYAGAMTRDQFRKAVAVLELDRGSKLGLLQGERPGGPPTPQNALAQARQQYLQILSQRDQYGAPQFDAADQYLNSLPPATQQYIHDQQLAGYGTLPPQARALMEQLWQVRQTTKPYFDLQQAAMDKYGLGSQLQAATPAQRLQLEASPKYQAVMRAVAQQKETMRLRNSDVDQALSAWYGDKPIRQVLADRLLHTAAPSAVAAGQPYLALPGLAAIGGPG